MDPCEKSFFFMIFRFCAILKVMETQLLTRTVVFKSIVVRLKKLSQARCFSFEHNWAYASIPERCDLAESSLLQVQDPVAHSVPASQRRGDRGDFLAAILTSKSKTSNFVSCHITFSFATVSFPPSICLFTRHPRRRGKTPLCLPTTSERSWPSQ